ncbi:MAG: PilZ domain-containing protein [Candidatus Omnitrophica bacterium]|nr:PilZ domain-containing protein [Candidatus Omnitrophota bacterium]
MILTFKESKEALNRNYASKSAWNYFKVYEQRREVRWPIQKKLFYRTHENILVLTKSINISHSGACISVLDNAKVGHQVQMKIVFNPYESVEIHGTILWKRKYIHKIIAGILFEKIEAKSRKRIDTYLHLQMVEHKLKGQP